MTNEQIACTLECVAERWAEVADHFRARAYHRAADVVRTRPVALAERYAVAGVAAVRNLPGIGAGIQRILVELLETGHLGVLDSRADARAERAIATVPGLGAVLAHRVRRHLGVTTLAELEAAALDGRLARVPGFGPRRVRGIRETLAGRLQRRRPAPAPAIPVAELLEVDREYRDQATSGSLVRIAPRRFNPTHAPWLPVLRTTRGPRHYTALFSNTARAHALGKTGDWVVLYVDDGRGEREATVVTETRGPLTGRRVVRGREDACAAHYATAAPAPPLPAARVARQG